MQHYRDNARKIEAVYAVSNRYHYGRTRANLFGGPQWQQDNNSGAGWLFYRPLVGAGMERGAPEPSIRYVYQQQGRRLYR